MRARLAYALGLPLLAAACGSGGDGPTPYDDVHGPSEDNVNEGAPANDTLPDDNKADAVYPAKLALEHQSPVKSQGSRGVCSIFASTALVENLYLKAGMDPAEADFSEQYLQWAAKKLQGAFTYTEGSSADANMQAVVKFGTVREPEWRYEPSPWTTANDPACTGESRPVRCYTNGEPPAEVAQATKYKVPSSRWINTGSIKAHLTTKGTGVNLGMTFFYQAWNHRASKLPVDADLWRRGVVTYPNAEDKARSLEQRAGHAIHVIGWDDDLEIPMRDGQGNPILDEDGNPRTEKGFWLFKNSWGTTGFGIEHPYGPGYGWLSYRYVKEYGSAVVAEIPALQQREVCDDAIDNDGDNRSDCDDAQCSADPACSGGGSSRTYTKPVNGAIPDVSSVTSTIDVSDTGSIADVKLTVDITHTYRGDLRLTLSKGSDSFVVFDRSGGSADNLMQTFSVTGLAGKDLSGAWILRVEDTARADIGTLKSWTLEVRTN